MKKLIKYIEGLTLILSRKLVVGLIKLTAYLNDRLSPVSNGPFEDLAPSDNADEDQSYSKRIKWALKNPRAKNIALTGPFGSGKSSIIQTFLRNHPEYNYLNISLATFKENNNDDTTKYELIEFSILQQIFYYVKHKTIPGSRFNRIKNITSAEQMLKTFFLICFAAGLLFILKKEWVLNFFQLKEFYGRHVLLVDYLIGSFMLIITFVGLYSIFKLYNNSRISKLNISGGEVDIVPKESSILNKQLEEILYFFEVSNYDVIIIEDLDRFKNTDIFTKLREINTLINNAKQINRKVSFIYALKDDMFLDERRTKFFDFIIPVIPVINVSNAGDLLLQRLKRAKLSHILSEEFIAEIGLYIDDMRLMKNVMNEFLLYKDRLNTFNLKYDNLFAIIIYKNKYPTDFADLHVNKGLVASLFNSKYKFIAILTEQMSKEKQILTERVKNANKEMPKNIAELRAIYLLALFDQLPDDKTGTVIISGSSLTLEELKNDASFSALRKITNIIYQNFFGYSQKSTKASGKSFSEIEKIVDPKISYEERERAVTDKGEEEIEQLRKRIEEIDSEMNRIKSYSLKEIAQKLSLTKMDPKFAEHTLLSYFIRYGYIDEQYYYYISYFYEGSITRQDVDFLLSIKDEKALPFDFRLNRVEELIKKIRPSEFSNREVLNIDLVNFLFEHKSKYNSYLDTLIGQFEDENEKSFGFIEIYAKNGKKVPEFIEALCASWPGFWGYLLSQTIHSDEQKNYFLVVILRHVSLQVIKEMNIENSLSDYISKLKSFLAIFDDKLLQVKVKSVLKGLDVKFYALQPPKDETQTDMLQFIGENNLFHINEAMISLLLSNTNRDSREIQDLLEKENYTTILKFGTEKQIAYINNHLGEYVNDVMLQLADNKYESLDTVLKLLNNEQIDYEQKRKIIAQQSEKIPSIGLVDSGLWEFLFQLNKVDCNWHNLYTYYLINERIDEPVIEFLNIKDNYLLLSRDLITHVSESIQSVLFDMSKDILTNPKISDVAIDHLANSLPFANSEITGIKISPERVAMLINKKLIALSAINFEELKAHYNNATILLIENNTDLFLNEKEKYVLDDRDYIKILTSDKITDAQKELFLQSLNASLLTASDSLMDTLGKLLIKTHIKVRFPIFEGVFNHSKDDDLKIILLGNNLVNLSDDEITRIVSNFNNGLEQVAVKGKHPLIKNKVLNLNLIDSLKGRGYLSSYTVKDGWIKVHTRKL